MDKSPSLQGETSHHCPDVESGASDQTSVVELVSQWTETDPNQFAIHHNASSWSYRELAHTFKRCAAQLKEIGVQQGDVVAINGGAREGLFRPAPLNDHMPLEEVTLAEALKIAGYKTFFAGKWHLGPTEEYSPENQGFDVNIGGWKLGAPRYGSKYLSPYGNPRLEDGPDGEHLPYRLANETMQFIEDNKSGPFLAYLSFYSVHTPLLAPEELVEKYKKKAERSGLVGTEEFGAEEQVLPIQQERRVRISQQHAIYAAMMEAMDTHVGRVLNKLEELGIAENTIVCFTSDNGGLSGVEIVDYH
jgi:arylsulfatase A-like enzyme